MATKPWDDSPPTIGERYGIATGTANLTGFGGMVPDGHGGKAADMLLAAGLCDSGLGATLMRLRHEWDSAAKPARPGPRLLKALAAHIHGEDEDAKQAASRNYSEVGPRKPVRWQSPGNVDARAIERAGQWYAGELRILAQSLRSKGEAVLQLTAWGAQMGIHSEAVSEAVLLWLDPTCPACHGHGSRQIYGQPSRQCHPCYGTGNRHRPPDSARVISHMDYCTRTAQAGIGRKLA